MFRKELGKIIGLLLLSALMLAAFAGCTSSDSPSGEVREVTLTEGWDFSSGFYPVLTPERSTNYGALYYAGNFYETLVNYDGGEFVPGLAQSWDISGDGLVYTFHLKKNIKFSDGAEFNAEAVKKNLEAVPVNLGSYNGTYGTVSAIINKVVAVDPSTVEVHLKTPYYGALKDFTMHNPMAMVSPNAFNPDGTVKDVLNTATLGTGPYMYEGTTDGTTYTFVRNPGYDREKPQVDRFHVKVVPDADARLLALRSGEIDLILGASKISYDAFKEMKTAEGYAAVVSDSAITTRLLGFNVNKAPFNDRNVRLAANYAIDKAGLVSGLFSGIETKADSLFDPSLPYCKVDLKPYEFSKEKAKALLQENGWVDSDGDGIREKNGVRLAGEIIYMTGASMRDDLALALSAQFKEAGMEIKVKGMEMMAYYAETMKDDFTVSLNETYGITYDPYTFINNMNSKLMKDMVASKALAQVNNGDALIEALNSATDEKKIQESYDFILREIHENAVFAPISYMKELALFNNKKIASYAFNGQLSNVDVAGIKLR
ncbi:MAG: transporter substrate-binding protein [Paenibacillaceae bacterium]|nr:transporter substrate-binding protein [Paenibacillaceae bacterium]